ncbi:preprotein translocase subunit YajC [Streptomyces sp. DSM 44917]|uniref:Preprotein translocase subunit YajC n=1 Tax=Streptomyces boetiae TaxID=3075541 RepID=A0ABU2LBX0_9ACTN|nr:preprotein translocase subunit YajC [Streptomyces sp. DSM 44917]MDT0308797.1 preprotein translocase subunit YajC [Streptomyces sp. DSM 44917]
MDPTILFPLVLLIGVFFLMSRSARNRQRQAMQMREAIEPGAGVRTIGGMYAEVKEVRDDTVLLEIEPGVHAVYAKNAIHAVLDHDEYRRIVSGESAFPDEETPDVPDDASSLTGDADLPGEEAAPEAKDGKAGGKDSGEDGRVELGKPGEDEGEDGPRS